jgi:hypothetical protein
VFSAGLLDQVAHCECAKEVRCLVGLYVGERRGRRNADLLAGVQAEQPEHARRHRWQSPVGPGEDGTDVRILVRRKCGEPLTLFSEVFSELGQTNGVSGDAFRCDGDGEREMAASVEDGLGGLRFIVDPWAYDFTQEPERIIGVEGGEGQLRRTCAHNQSGERDPAGHQDRAAGCPGEQWTHLVRRDRVVEHDQDAAIVRHRAKQRCSFLLAGWYVRGSQSQGNQEVFENLGGAGR